MEKKKHRKAKRILLVLASVIGIFALMLADETGLVIFKRTT